MHMWKKGCLGLALVAGLTPSLRAQIPLTPPSAGGATMLAAPPAAQPTTIWDKLGLSKIQREACKEYMCKTQIGQLMNNSLAPLGALTGGILGPCCPPFNKEDLLKPPDSAEGAAARIKQDEANAKARRAAVRYLGTVDCHYWPEASDALIGALRTDRNECVRWEAAMALGSGCCCNKATIKALAITVSGGEEDGNPAETSERVKAAAARSLAHCLASCAAVVQPLPVEPAPADKIEPVPVPVPNPLPEPRPEKGGAAAAPGATDYYKQVRKMDINAVVQDARRAQAHSEDQAAAKPGMPRDRTVFGLFRAAFGDSKSEKATAAPSSAPVPPTAEPPGLPKAMSPAPQGPAVPVSAAPPPLPAQVAAAGMMPYPPAFVPPPLPAPPAAPVMSAQQLVTLLQTSAFPDQREWAVTSLGNCDGQANPQAVQAVLTAARQDPAPMVRAACIRCLVRMNVNTWQVLDAVQALKGDADPRVKNEADRAMARLVPSGAPSGIVPVGGTH